MYIFSRKAGAIRHGILLAAVLPVVAHATSVRLVTYNTQADVGISNSVLLPNLETVIEGIGQQKYAGDGVLQPPDIIALQETTSNAVTVAPMVTDLNNHYLNSNYSYSGYQATQSGGNTSGNGPNALIYNQATLNLNSSAGVGTPAGSGNGEYRQVVRYQFQPLLDKGTSAGFFYVYDCHAKSLASGAIATDQTYQKEEAVITRNDEATLPANSAVIYVGDFNVDGSTDPSMVEMSSAGQGQAFDPLNPSNASQNWATNSTYKSIMTESDTNLRYRDDLQLVTSNILNGSPGTLNYVANSEHAFGNNGTTNEGSTINSAANTALNDIIGHGPLTPSQVLAVMNGTTGSDHLPVVVDYTIATTDIWLGGTGNWSNSTYWTNGVVPNDSTTEVKIDNSNPVASVVTLDQIANVSDIVLDAGDNLTINAGQALILNGPTASVFNGLLTISGTISGANVSTGATGNVVLPATGTLAISGTFTNQGSTQLNGLQNWSSGAIFNNSGGITSFNTDAGRNGSSLIVNVLGGTVFFSSTQHLAGLNISSGLTASVSGGGNGNRSVLITPSLTVAGTLNLTGNDLDVQNVNLTAVNALVKQGNIASTTAAGDSTHLTAIGVIQNNQSGSALFTASHLFGGIVPGVGDVLAAYTYVGDANLDGKVDGSDYSLIDSAYLANKTSSGQYTGWFNGDFNYDGTIDGSDYTLIDNAFNSQGAQLTAMVASETAQIGGDLSTSTVPEPAGEAMLILATTMLSIRTRISLLGRRFRAV